MDSKNRLEHITHCLVEYRKLWLIPAIAGLVLATVYAFFIKGETWTSRQTMIIRDDLLGETFKPGQFLNEEAMKSAQETVLETARRPEVIRKTLEKLGPSRKSLFGQKGASDWPSQQDIEDFRGAVSFESANGGEFGKSEVIVLAAKASSPERAIKFLSILTDQIDGTLAEVRASRLESMESELAATCASALKARGDLEDKIKSMDESFGTNISIVQSMNQQGSGGSPSAFDNKLNQIRADRRGALGQMASLNSFKGWLQKASQNPSTELAISRELLGSQPELSELSSELAKAKSELSVAESQYQEKHSSVRKGQAKVASLKRQIKELIPTLLDGIDNQISVLNDRVGVLDGMLAENAEMIKDISSKRVPYAALSREFEKQTENHSASSARLAQVRSRKIASASIQLLTRMGEPWVGTRADGMGPRTLSLIGGIGGLMFGFGLVMIVAPPFVDPDQSESGATQSTTGTAATVPAQQHVAEQVAPTSQPEPVPETANPPQEFAETLAPTADVSTPSAPVTPPAPAVTPVQEAPSAHVPLLVSPLQMMPRFPQGEAGNASPDVSDRATLADSQPAAQSVPDEAAPTIEEPKVDAVPSPPVVVIEQQSEQPTDEPETAPPEPQPVGKRSVSKTLAAIFADMPQPRTDGVATPMESVDPIGHADFAETSQLIDDKINALSTELGNTFDVPEIDSNDREQIETIQLDENGIVHNAPIPLQRRSSVRPVDLARTEEAPEETPKENAGQISRENIDSAFSELNPSPSESDIRDDS